MTHVVDPIMFDACVEHVLAAGEAEAEAFALDRANNRKEAIDKYRICTKELDAAIAVAIPDHAEDIDKLIMHKDQVLLRINHLASNPSMNISVEDQIKPVQLAMVGPSTAPITPGSAVKMKMATMAGIGVVGGAIGDAARMAGSITLKVGNRAQQINHEHKITETLADKITQGASHTTAKATAKAWEINEKHHVSEKMAAGVYKGLDKIWKKVLAEF